MKDQLTSITTVGGETREGRHHKLIRPRKDNEISKFMKDIKTAILRDPGLPQAKPTVSAWQVPEHPLASHQSVSLPVQTDFAIIGSGITGCSVAKSILEHEYAKGSHVTVLEARTLASGATGRNGGHLVTASGHTFGPLAEKHGVEAAKQITRFSILNIEFLMQMVRKMDLPTQEYCQIRDVLKVMAVGDEETWQRAKRSVLEFQQAVPEHKSLHRIIEKEDIAERWNIKDVVGAVEHEAGAIWPYRLVTSVFAALLKENADRLAIETNTPVLVVDYVEGSGNEHYSYKITTPRGVIYAKKIVHCTNGHAAHLLPALAGRIYPFRGTMTVQKPGVHLKNLGATRSWSLAHKPSLDPDTGLYITGLYYLQQNALTGRIWIGNETANMEDILTSDDTDVPDVTTQALTTVLPKFFLKGWGTAKKSEIEAVWSGIQGHTADGLPVVGRVPASVSGNTADAGQWIAAGFNGYGMDKCWLTGKALVDMMFNVDVSDWFPQAFLATEDRLQAKLTADKTLNTFAQMITPKDTLQAKL